MVGHPKNLHQIKHLSWSSLFPRLLMIWLSRTSIRRSPCRRRRVESGQRLTKHLSFIPHAIGVRFAPDLRHISWLLNNDLQVEFCLKEEIASIIVGRQSFNAAVSLNYQAVSPSNPFHLLAFQEPDPLLVALSPLLDIHACQMQKEIDNVKASLLHLQHFKATWSSACLCSWSSTSSLLDLQHDYLLARTCPHCHLLVLLPWLKNNF